MEQGLPLARAAERVSWNTVPFHLCDLPSADLPSVLIHQAAAHIERQYHWNQPRGSSG